ncbi:MAG: hypothetical protein AAFX56_05095 [Pseudomonadota bacterium]
MKDFLSDVLPMFVTGLFVAFGLSYLSREAKDAPDDGRIEYGRAIKALAWLSTAIATAAIVFMVVADHGGEYIWISAFAALFGLMGLYLLIEGYGTKGRFDDRQIVLSSLFGRTRVGRWSDLKEAAFKKNGQYFQFVFSDGTKIGLSKMIRGHRAVCDRVESLGFTVEDRPY